MVFPFQHIRYSHYSDLWKRLFPTYNHSGMNQLYQHSFQFAYHMSVFQDHIRQYSCSQDPSILSKINFKQILTDFSHLANTFKSTNTIYTLHAADSSTFITDTFIDISTVITDKIESLLVFSNELEQMN